jgi:hypothetical protein
MDALIVIAILCALLWGGGMAFHVGNFVHVLLLVLVVVVIVRLIQGRKPLP